MGSPTETLSPPLAGVYRRAPESEVRLRGPPWDVRAAGPETVEAKKEVPPLTLVTAGETRKAPVLPVRVRALVEASRVRGPVSLTAASEERACRERKGASDRV